MGAVHPARSKTRHHAQACDEARQMAHKTTKNTSGLANKNPERLKIGIPQPIPKNLVLVLSFYIITKV